MSSSSRATPVLGCRFYRTAAGAAPVREWLRSLSDDECGQIGQDILRIQWRWPVGKPLVDGLGNGLYEVRTSYDRNEYRVYFIVVDGAMVLLHGCQKKTRKAALADINVARRRQKEEGT